LPFQGGNAGSNPVGDTKINRTSGETSLHPMPLVVATCSRDAVGTQQLVAAALEVSVGHRLMPKSRKEHQNPPARSSQRRQPMAYVPDPSINISKAPRLIRGG
jgi:hypothetical protein